MAERISHDEATEIAHRFIAFRFGNRDKHGKEIIPRASIPADPARDDDIRLMDYIEQQRSKDFGERIGALEKEIAELRERRGGGG